MPDLILLVAVGYTGETHTTLKKLKYLPPVFVRFKVFMAVTVKKADLWDVA
jgi:hypothetical protein